MSNATVSSQVYVIRNNGALAAVSAGTMIVYADGTDLYAKDENGNTYNLTHPSASNLSVALNSLTDVTVAAPADNQILQYNISNAQWENVNPAVALAEIISLADLSDVSSTSPNDGQALVWSNANQSWEPGTVTSSGSSSALEDLTDVSLTSLTSGETLQYNGTNWVNTTLVEDFVITDGANSLTVTDGYSLLFSAGTGISVAVSSQSSRVQISLNATTDQITEATNQYFTTGRVDAHLNTSTASANQILSWDGTDYVWVADQTGSGGSSTFIGLTDTISSMGAVNSIAHVENVGGVDIVSFSDLKVSDNSGAPLVYTDTANTASLGIATSHFQNVYSRNLFITGASSSTTLANYAKIVVDEANQKRLQFNAVPTNNIHYYEFKDSGDNTSVELYIEGNGNYFGFKTDSNMSQSQMIKLPQAMGTNGQVLALSGISGNNADLDWTHPGQREEVYVRPNQLSVLSGAVTGAGMGSPTYNYGLGCTLQTIYADSSVDPGDTATINLHVDNVVFTDNTEAGQLTQQQASASFSLAMFFDHFIAGDTLDVVVSMIYYNANVSQGVNSSSLFITSQVTKSITLTSTTGGTVGQFVLTVAELDSLLPSNATVASGSKSGTKWHGVVAIKLQNFSASATNADCKFEGASLSAAGSLYGMALKKVL